ncbi:FxSxx-COOH system tetratricopeptide repeat protein [Actinocorallia sp. B10E7]|uniref:FxSxx-COOH system tetratricopeptide repeat protein n=1 Tax=Actinocorallia sp. B10E7 TaxID=3153558 RepID=UPI00325CCA03
MENADPMGTARKVPEVWGKVPPRNKNFTGREDLLAALHKGISGRPTAVVPHALHGFGGVGKTQMAVEYAYRYGHEYDLVWWIPADQPVLVRSSLAGLAPHLNVPSASTSGVEEAANAVLDALRKGEPYARWLLIFDNADQPEDINTLLPQGSGHVLITSRNHRWESVVATFPIDVFDRRESVEFLTRRVPRGISESEADRLAHELGDLPLALEQAGALQAETGMGVEEYLGLLEAETQQLLSQGKPTEYPLSMTAAWAISVARLKERLPEAISLLRCCAFFGPEPIPRDAFTRVGPEAMAQLSPELGKLLANPIMLSKVIGELGRYALAKLDTPARTIQIHRLIQALLREDRDAGQQATLRHEVHVLLASYAPELPSDATNWEKFGHLLGHMEPARVAECAEPAVREMALRVVRFLFSSGDYGYARIFVRRFLEEWARQSGELHPDVFSMALEYANVRRELGEYKEVAEYNAEMLQKAEAALGANNAITLRFLRGVSADLRGAGDFQEARRRGEESVRRAELNFGPDDPFTLRALNNLGLDYGLSSDYQEAKNLHMRAFQGLVVHDVVDTTVNAWTGLARAVRLCGDYSEATDLGEDAYAYALETLGPDHSWTLRTAKDLSIAWRRVGDFERAYELADLAHSKFMRSFGIDHPDTLAAAMCLANIRRTVGEKESALELAADTVRRYPRVYGEEHPYNHGCVGNLAIMRRVMGDPEEARRLNEGALAGLERKLGKDHHYTLTVASNLASDLAELGETGEAVRRGEDTLGRLREVLGGRHPLVLACAANLTADLRAVGRRGEADKLFQETKEAYAQTLGLEHPDAKVFLEGRHLDADFDPPPI